MYIPYACTLDLCVYLIACTYVYLHAYTHAVSPNRQHYCVCPFRHQHATAREHFFGPDMRKLGALAASISISMQSLCKVLEHADCYSFALSHLAGSRLRVAQQDQLNSVVLVKASSMSLWLQISILLTTPCAQLVALV